MLFSGWGGGIRTRECCFKHKWLYYAVLLNNGFVMRFCKHFMAFVFVAQKTRNAQKKTSFFEACNTKCNTKTTKNYFVKEVNLAVTASVAAFFVSGRVWVYIFWRVSADSQPPRSIIIFSGIPWAWRKVAP